MNKIFNWFLTVLIIPFLLLAGILSFIGFIIALVVGGATWVVTEISCWHKD